MLLAVRLTFQTQDISEAMMGSGHGDGMPATAPWPLSISAKARALLVSMGVPLIMLLAQLNCLQVQCINAVQTWTLEERFTKYPRLHVIDYVASMSAQSSIIQRDSLQAGCNMLQVYSTLCFCVCVCLYSEKPGLHMPGDVQRQRSYLGHFQFRTDFAAT